MRGLSERHGRGHRRRHRAEPTASVRCGPRLSDNTVLLEDPQVVVEITGPSPSAVPDDLKVALNFRLPFLRHCVVVRTGSRSVVHHARPPGTDDIRTGILPADATLTLDPPGIEFDLSRLFA